MALLNQLLSEADLAKLTNEQKDFLAQRIDFALDTDAEIHELLAKKLASALSHVGGSNKIQPLAIHAKKP